MTLSPQGEVRLAMPRWLKKHIEQQRSDLWGEAQHPEGTDVVGRAVGRSKLSERALWLGARARWNARIRFEERRRRERSVAKVSLSTHRDPNPRTSADMRVEQARRERHVPKKTDHPPSKRASVLRISKNTSMMRSFSATKRRTRWKRSPTLIDVLERLVPLKRAAPKNRL